MRLATFIRGTCTRLLARFVLHAGGRHEAFAIALFATVLALDSADHATVGSSAVPLQHSLHITLTEIGLLSTVSSVVGAIGTLAFGVVVDRVNRSRLLGGAVALWAIAMVAGALSPSFVILLISRLFLGAITAVAGPAIASMVGDLFAPGSRGRVYGLILSGELIGVGIGFAATGSIAALSWRAAFFVLAVPAVALAPMLWRMGEPARGGALRPRLATDPDTARASERVTDVDVPPYPELVLHEDPVAMSLPRVVRYVLRIRTNVLLVVASVCGYYFFSGLSTFGIAFVRHHYHVGQAQASSLTLVLGVGAVAGVLTSGRLADRLLERGRRTARVDIAIVALAATVLLFIPALISTTLLIALPLFVAAAFTLGSLNPPLDAARLDIMPPRLWGRAEGVRSVLRSGAQAGAPLAFGAMSEHLFGGGGAGLTDTFLVMLVPLAASVGVGVVARRTYLRDVATANASAAATTPAAAPVTAPAGEQRHDNTAPRTPCMTAQPSGQGT